MSIYDFLTFNGTVLENIYPFVVQQLEYFYVIEVADSESDLGLHDKRFISEISAYP